MDGPAVVAVGGTLVAEPAAVAEVERSGTVVLAVAGCA
jgi:hypothetical protein